MHELEMYPRIAFAFQFGMGSSVKEEGQSSLLSLLA